MQQPQTSGWTAKLMIESDTYSQPADGLLLTSIIMTSPHNLYDLIVSDCVRACVRSSSGLDLSRRAGGRRPSWRRGRARSRRRCRAGAWWASCPRSSRASRSSRESPLKSWKQQQSLSSSSSSYTVVQLIIRQQIWAPFTSTASRFL